MFTLVLFYGLLSSAVCLPKTAVYWVPYRLLTPEFLIQISLRSGNFTWDFSDFPQVLSVIHIIYEKMAFSLVFSSPSTAILQYLTYFKEEDSIDVINRLTMMIIIYWEMTPCGSHKNRRFGDRIASIFRVHECEQVTERSCKLLYRQRHGVISQKMIIIIVTAVETSNLTID
jgi:hypothetical protein